jgi:AmmeMemoRadiSam system protein B/AmmeMemoRadiSam system protein A
MNFLFKFVKKLNRMTRPVMMILLLQLMMAGHACAQEKTRPMAVAGSFYAADPAVLRKDLDFLFSRADPRSTSDQVLAVIAPHAGYPFSGEVAATGYRQVDPKRQFHNIFLIGSSHRHAFNGAAIYLSGDFKTPLGTVPANQELARKLTDQEPAFIQNDMAHLGEHSLEVQLPFLQYHLEKDFKIVPILLGTRSQSTCRKIANALEPYLNEDNLFVISSDFSHYPDYWNAKEVDIRTAKAICTNSSTEFLSVLDENEEKNIPNLATSACAWPAILTLLYMTEQKSANLSYKLVRYQNSGDSPHGDKNRVVGYCSIMVTASGSKNEARFMLSQKDKKDLIEIARQTLDTYVGKGRIPEFRDDHYSEALQTHTGAFVTLHKNGNLRGCIGRFAPDKPLYQVVRDMTISASTKDYRFQPVTPEELEEIDLEISVLTPLTRIDDPSEIVLGLHGIYIKKGGRSGTFLPQVAAQTGWTLEEFLGHCAQDKAHLGWYGWKDAEIYTYEALIFSEHEVGNE